MDSFDQQGPPASTKSVEKWTHFLKTYRLGSLAASRKLNLKRTKLVDSNQNGLCPWDVVGVRDLSQSLNSSLISKDNSQRHGFPVCSPQTIGGIWEKRESERERDKERSYVLLIAVLVPAACHSSYSWGLFCVGGLREERFCHGTAKWEMTRFPQTWRLIGLLWIS